ncbi:hypothetical protein AVEN_156830-1 [Araneus ventricosus]|uniref:DUF7041 domain-containing protein n=1 Tax=Araneus ventricosus TaxID=182803 RepID=A0A4Y2RD00_ARAVE|nr:hypothetical protein AVEN_156830-1 [Araneus ventricosus]
MDTCFPYPQMGKYSIISHNSNNFPCTMQLAYLKENWELSFLQDFSLKQLLKLFLYCDFDCLVQKCLEITSDDDTIARAGVKLPPFWKSNPAVWIVELEEQFALAGITVDDTRFNHFISAVDSEILNSLSDIVLRPTDSDEYTILKKRLIELHSGSEASKIGTLFQGLELGDKSPSQLLTRMIASAGDTGEPLLKSLWLGRLPNNTQTILAAFSEDLDALTTVADKVSDLTNYSTINAVHFTLSTSDARVTQLEQVTQLTTLVCELTSTKRQIRSQGRDRQFNYRRSHLPDIGNIKNTRTYYHSNFGRNAKK